MIENILTVIIINANIPSECEWNEEMKSPLNKNEIEFPNPQPGQNSIPKFFRGQIVKWVDSGELINAR